jgi:hypothetical protein
MARKSFIYTSYHLGNDVVDQILMRMLEWQNRFVDLGCWFAGSCTTLLCLYISRLVTEQDVEYYRWRGY